MRTLVDIPNDQIAALAALCEQVKQPRAAIVRAAIAEYLAKRQGADGEDGLAFQEKARAEW
jgi:predicted transcriptional regulator